MSWGGYQLCSRPPGLPDGNRGWEDREGSHRRPALPGTQTRDCRPCSRMELGEVSRRDDSFYALRDGAGPGGLEPQHLQERWLAHSGKLTYVSRTQREGRGGIEPHRRGVPRRSPTANSSVQPRQFLLSPRLEFLDVSPEIDPAARCPARGPGLAQERRARAGR